MSCTDPTLTHVPPLRLFSTSSVFAPYQPEALLAAPEPPLPPPMTMKSYCLATGAMVDNCLEMLANGEGASVAKKRINWGGVKLRRII